MPSRPGRLPLGLGERVAHLVAWRCSAITCRAGPGRGVDAGGSAQRWGRVALVTKPQQRTFIRGRVSEGTVCASPASQTEVHGTHACQGQHARGFYLSTWSATRRVRCYDDDAHFGRVNHEQLQTRANSNVGWPAGLLWSFLRSGHMGRFDPIGKFLRRLHRAREWSGVFSGKKLAGARTVR
jgi:hypothetical protein